MGTCNPSYLVGWIAWTREVEIAVTWDRIIALQAWAIRVKLSQKKKEKKKRLCNCNLNALKNKIRPDAVTHICDASILGDLGQITWGQEFETSLTNIVKPSLYKNTKISRVWWRMPVSQLLGRLMQKNHLNPEAEVIVSWDHATTLQPEQQSKTLFQKKKKKILTIDCWSNIKRWTSYRVPNP